MPPNPSDRPARYHTFLLKLWEEAGRAPNWRCSLENPHTGERVGFKDLAELTIFLTRWMAAPPSGERPPLE